MHRPKQRALANRSWRGTFNPAASMPTSTNCSSGWRSRATDQQRARSDWPKATNLLSGSLTRLAGDLRKIGIAIDQSLHPRSRRKMFTIRKVGKTAFASFASFDGNDFNGLQRRMAKGAKDDDGNAK
jgi:hypothetical protein